MKKISKECFLLNTIIGMYVLSRWFVLKRHFSHFDDAGVAHHIKWWIDNFSFTPHLIEKINGSSILGNITSTIYYIFQPLIENLYMVIKFSERWTYAPLQFMLTNLFLKFGHTYDEIMLLGRMPSFLFSIATIYVIYIIVDQITDEKYMKILGVAIIGFSWQSIIYSAHMSNYQSIIFMGFLMIYFMIKYSEKQKKFPIAVLMVSVVGTYLHYQVTLYALAACFTLFLFDLLIVKEKHTKVIYKYLLYGFSYLIMISPLMYFVIKRKLYLSSLNWNVGLDAMYLYDSSKSIIGFLIQNIFIVVRAMLNPVDVTTMTANIIAFVYISIIVIGLLQLFLRIRKVGLLNINRKQLLGLVFSLSLSLIVLLLVITKKSTLSPTRHSNLLIPVLWMFIMNGVLIIKEKIKVAPLILTAVLVGVFIGNFSDILEERIDPFSQNLFVQVYDKYSPDVVASFDYSPQVEIALDQNHNFDLHYYDYGCYYVRKNTKEFNSIVFMSHRPSFTDNQKNKLVEKMVSDKIIDEIQAEEISLGKIVPIILYGTSVEVDFDSSTKNGTNGLYIYELRRD